MTKSDVLSIIDANIHDHVTTKITGGILNTVLKSILDYDFQYQKTLFVDPNGDNNTAMIGRIDLPWCTISEAITYLRVNDLENHTVWVFPGIYSIEDTWIFSNNSTSSGNNNNTTVKLQGGVNIISNGTLIKLDNTNSLSGDSLKISIIGDKQGSINMEFGTNVTIQTNNGNNIEFISRSSTTQDVSEINFSISNISLICGANGYGYEGGSGFDDMYNISYEGYITGKFSCYNCSFKNLLTNNWSRHSASTFALWGAIVILKNTYWETKIFNSKSNWHFNDTDESVQIAYFLLENSKFCIKGENSNEIHHIVTHTSNQEKYYMMWANLVFYSIYESSMWQNIYSGEKFAKLYLTGDVTGVSDVTGVDVISSLKPIVDTNLIDISIFQE
jgi:hypothetical protein